MHIASAPILGAGEALAPIFYLNMILYYRRNISQIALKSSKDKDEITQIMI